MKQKREGNYDLLRVTAMVAVLMIHVSSIWIRGYADCVTSGMKIGELIHPFWVCVYNSVSRFAVPCFIMLSGAFIMDDVRNEEYHYFYKKKLKKILIPTIIFTVLYVAYSGCSKMLLGADVRTEIMEIAKNVVKGSPFYHMWYMYMLVEVYLLAPIVVRFKNSIPYDKFRKIAFIFLALACVSWFSTENIRLSWSVGQSFEYLGYFMIGYVLRRDAKKNNVKGGLCILAGFGVEVLLAYVQYRSMANGGLKLFLANPYSPVIVLASVLIFYGFGMLDTKENTLVGKLSDFSFTVYLFHAGVWDFLITVISNTRGVHICYWKPIHCTGFLSLS